MCLYTWKPLPISIEYWKINVIWERRLTDNSYDLFYEHACQSLVSLKQIQYQLDLRFHPAPTHTQLNIVGKKKVPDDMLTTLQWFKGIFSILRTTLR